MSSTTKATFWMLGCLVSFSFMAVGGREASAEISTSQLLLLRSIVGVVIVFVIAFFSSQGIGFLKTNILKLHGFRATAHFAGQFGWFYGIAFLPLAQVFAIEFTAPIWIALLAVLFLGERFSIQRVITILVGFTGVLIMLRPGVMEISSVTWIVVGAALAFAITHTTTKFLTRSEPTIRILFYMTLLQIPIGLAFSIPSWVWPSSETLVWTSLIGVAALCAHMCLTKALSLADATVVTPLDFLRLPFIAVVGFALYAETVDLWFMVGAAVVFGANYINVMEANRRARISDT